MQNTQKRLKLSRFLNGRIFMHLYIDFLVHLGLRNVNQYVHPVQMITKRKIQGLMVMAIEIDLSYSYPLF